MPDSTVKITVKTEDQTTAPLEKIRQSYKEGSQDVKTFGQAMAEAFAKPDADLSNLKGQMEGWISTLKSATSENQNYALEMMKITEAYKSGNMSAKDAQSAIEKLRDDMKQSETSAKGFGGQLKDMFSSVDNVVQSFTGLSLASVLSAAGISKVVEQIKMGVGVAAEAQAINAQLGAVIRSTGGAAGMTADELDKLATSLGDQAAFCEDDVKKGEALMLTFTNIGRDTFPSAMQAAINLSSAFGQDLNSSIIQVAKALNDPAGMAAMKRIGISFSEAQMEMGKSMYEAGDMAGYQKMILDELNKETGGAAVANAQTLIGKQRELKNSWEDLWKAGAMPYLDILTQVNATGSAVVKGFTASEDEVRKVKTDWMDYIPALNTAKGAYITLESVIRNVNDALKEQKLDAAITGAETKTAPGGEWDWNDSEREKMHAKNAATSAGAKATDTLADFTDRLERSEAGAYQRTMMLTKANQGYSAEVKTVTGAVKLHADTLEDLDKLTKNAADENKKLADATKAAADAQEEFNQNYGERAAQSLSKYAGEGKKYREGLAIQDKVMGTNTAAQYDAQKAMDALSQQFARGQITAQQYEQGLKDLQPTFEGFDTNLQKTKKSLQEAMTSWDTFLSKLGAANGQVFTVKVIAEYSGEGGGPVSGGGRQGTPTGTGVAHPTSRGMDFWVPPGYPNDSFNLPLRVESGEHVIVVPASEATGGKASRGNIGRGGGSSSIYAPITINAVINGQQDVARLGVEIANTMNRRVRR